MILYNIIYVTLRLMYNLHVHEMEQDNDYTLEESLYSSLSGEYI